MASLGLFVTFDILRPISVESTPFVPPYVSLRHRRCDRIRLLSPQPSRDPRQKNRQKPRDRTDSLDSVASRKRHPTNDSPTTQPPKQKCRDVSSSRKSSSVEAIQAEKYNYYLIRSNREPESLREQINNEWIHSELKREPYGLKALIEGSPDELRRDLKYKTLTAKAEDVLTLPDETYNKYKRIDSKK